MVGEYEFINGDSLAVLKDLPDGYFQCCVTSPPYWGLRDYGVDGQIGLEQTPEEYTARLVDVFREVRRAMSNDGTLWLNLGDSYASSGTCDMGGHKGLSAASERCDGLKRNPENKATQNGKIGKVTRRLPAGLKVKDLVGIPWSVAFALRADGWYLRSDIIWAKPNPMPESVTDRPTRGHEYLFLLTKSPKYYYDIDAIKEPLKRPEESKRKTPAKFGGAFKFEEASKQSRLHSGKEYTGTNDGKRNRRSVWTVAPKPFKEAHFAVMPEDLVEPCILAGSAHEDFILDPFAGAGTTGLVAIRNGRHFIGIELNPEYIAIADKRLKEKCPVTPVQIAS